VLGAGSGQRLRRTLPALFGDAEGVECPLDLQQLDVYYASPEGDCSCDPPVGTSCVASVESHESEACNEEGIFREVGTTCDGLVPPRAVGSVTTSGTCEVPSAQVDGGSVSTVTVCEILGGGCEDREVCAPPVGVISNTTVLLCIGAPGDDVDCPAPWDLVRPVHTSSELHCSCECSLGEDGCAGVVQTWSDGACTTCQNDSCTAFAAPREGPCLPLETQPQGWVLGGVTYDGMIPEPGPIEQAGDTITLCCMPYPVPG
jgi:hypothetical protein